MEFWGHVDTLVDRLSSVSYFELLGVDRSAEPLAIRDAYYAALRRYHPDRYVVGDQAAERQRKLALICARIGEAYRTLSNPTARADYVTALAGGRTRSRPTTLRRNLTDSRDPRTDKGRSLLASARDLVARGNRAGARAKLELALQFEPDSKVLAAALAELAPKNPDTNEAGRNHVTFRAPPVVGIDLGTTNTVAAVYPGDGNIQVIRDGQGSTLFPSVVAFTPQGEVLVGEDARVRRIIDAPNTIFSSKRIIGQSYQSPAVIDLVRLLPYRVIEGNHQEPMTQTRAGVHTMSQIASLILGHVLGQARRQTGTNLTQCVITVPANFTDSQRQATRHAAELAGLEVLRILNEPTAAAVAYGHHSSRQERIAVFDLGGGTFDLTVLAVREGLFEVVATGGDPFLGGDDMDRLLANHLAQDFLEEKRVDLRTIPESYARLLLVAEDIKKRLTDTVLVDDVIREISYGVGGEPLDMAFSIRRERFEHLISALVDRALDVGARVLREANLLPGQLDGLILVGGATRTPLVRRRLEERFGIRPRVEINPLEVVAIGAAMQALRLVAPDAAGDNAALLVDVTSHALGIATTAGYCEHLIPKNTPIPAEGRQIFTTAKDNQTLVRVRVCQGSSRHWADNVAVGEIRLPNLRPAPRGEVKVEVSFLIDANGTLSVAAQDLETGQREDATLELVGVDLTAAAPAAFSDDGLPAPTG